MPDIKPISELRNDIKNGRGRFAVRDIKAYEQNKAALQLLSALARGKKAGEEQGWLSTSELEESLEEDDGRKEQ